MLYKFKLRHNVSGKTICYTKVEGTVDESTVTRGPKKFRSGCKNLDDQARSGWPKTGCLRLCSWLVGLVGWVLRHVNPLGYFMPNTTIGKKNV